MSRNLAFWLCTTLLLISRSAIAEPQVQLGIDVLRADGFALLQGKRVGLVANPASVDTKLQPTVRVLLEAPGVTLAALFGPEHGVWGDVYAGEQVEDQIDATTGLPVYSLYARNRKPSKEMLDSIDVLVLDLQDIGARSYTYISTMRACLEACAEHDKPFIVLDRPNPLGGIRVEGGPVEPGFESFVSYLDIPYLHGMTMGELAMLARDRHAPAFEKLSVVRMRGWTREMTWPDTGLTWVPTSPHIPTFAAAVGYAVTGIAGELRQLSNGVGYTQPFEIVGMPGIDGERLAAELRRHLHGEGIVIRPIRFRPFYSTHAQVACQGVQFHVDPRRAQTLIEWNYRIIQALGGKKLLEESSRRHAMFDKVNGGPAMRQALQSGEPIEPILQQWKEHAAKFAEIRRKWLLY
ncbi:MAG: DUF1343 domain-containing protein [Phycisphaerae bacterium]|nr:DUF1343 domain-containing protein [Phycisphaerae bacterium]MDW8262584.1 DUF1343 domain-containing protein [Phycisphaerales bacterium]